LTKKRISSLIVAVLSVALSACVTHEFENDETPVVKTKANRDDMAATRVSLGLGYLRMGNMSQAKQNLEKAKRFSPEMVQVYTAFAHYYETVGENKLAISSFEQALSLKSDDADTLNNYGVFLCRQDQIEAAEKQFLKAIAVPSYILVAKSYENLSSCFLQKNNFGKAEMYLYKAVMHSPGNSSTLLQMVRLQYAMGKYTQAKSYQQRFEKVIRRFSPQSLALAYKVYLKLGQRLTAKNYGAMLVKIYPQSSEAQQYLLNKLELIEADSLAKRYKLTQISDVDTKSKKRVVKLSPKKALPSNVANNSSLVESLVAKSKALQAATVTKVTTTKIINNTARVSSVPVANFLAINAALTMTTIETVPPISEKKEVIDSKLPANPNDQDKRVVVLLAPKVKEPLTIDSVQTQSSGSVSNKSPQIYVVTTGDTLFDISTKYNIKISALRRWNNIAGNKKIRINDKLHLIAPETVNK
jgi:type IV pilus assembly protein PilF